MLLVAAWEFQTGDFVTVTNNAGVTLQAANPGGAQLAIFPHDIDLEPTARSQPLNPPVWPGIGQSRQQLQYLNRRFAIPDFGLWTLVFGLFTLYFTFLALQQHLANPGGDTEITIQLHRRVQAEK